MDRFYMLFSSVLFFLFNSVLSFLCERHNIILVISDPDMTYFTLLF